MARHEAPLLSKSRFLAGLQCQLRLWYQCYQPELASAVSAAQEAMFQAGREVGTLATGLHPEGILIEPDYQHHEEAVLATRGAMENPGLPAFFEAAFLHDGVRVRVDILERAASGWNLVEVKSSTSVKEVHLADLAIQYHVLVGSGLRLARAGILHLNRQYEYDGRTLDLRSLFTFADLTDTVLALQKGISTRLPLLREMLARPKAPDIRPSRHCLSPYSCEFWEHCTAAMPEFWVLQLSGITQVKLDRLALLGIDDTRDIPSAFPLSKLQARIRDSVLNDKGYVAPELVRDLRDVEYPLHFLDFETMAPAIPRYRGTRPYQAIPFQWSDHILSDTGSLEHRYYLCGEDRDPRAEFAATLLDAIGERGTIFIYTNYEREILTRLAREFPACSEQLLAPGARFRDLQAAIRRSYYHPRFYGSFSLKAVLPALVPALSYESLAIREGSLASLAYLRMLDPVTPAGERAKIREDLLAYCGHDTLGMVRIREELLRRTGALCR
jgi:predicted RecB family nuclease